VIDHCSIQSPTTSLAANLFGHARLWSRAMRGELAYKVILSADRGYVGMPRKYSYRLAFALRAKAIG
jgi:hypothetical protein